MCTCDQASYSSLAYEDYAQSSYSSAFSQPAVSPFPIRQHRKTTLCSIAFLRSLDSAQINPYYDGVLSFSLLPVSI